MLLLLLLEHLGVGLLSLHHHLLRLFQFPQPILHILLFLKQLVLHLVVVAEEEHLVVDERLEGVSLEAHVYQEDQVVQQVRVLLGRREVALGELRAEDGLKVMQLGDYLRVDVVSLQRNVEEEELVPGGMEELVQEGVLLGVAPQRDEGVVVFP